MSETYFDTREGVLLIGEAAIGPRLEEAGTDVLPLPELITMHDFPFKPGDYERQQPKEWSRDDCINYGHWVLKLLADAPQRTAQETRLTRVHIERLFWLGVGPSRGVITTHFGPMWSYAEQLGAHSGKSSVKFRSWSRADYVQYAAGVANQLKRKPRESDYEAQYRALKGPSMYSMLDSVGGIRKLNENIGYPNIYDWSEDDYIFWGCRVAMANPGNVLTARLLSVLSKAKRGPSVSIIRQKFGDFSKFQNLVTQHGVEEAAERERQDEDVRLRLRTVVQKESLGLPEGLTADEELLVAARLLVALRCLPTLNAGKCLKMALTPTSQFIRMMCKAEPQLTIGYIETTATTLGVFDYVWPMDEWREYLRVTPDQLGYKREGNKRRFVSIEGARDKQLPARYIAHCL